MIGREAYHNPWWLAQWDAEFFGEPPTASAANRWKSRCATTWRARPPRTARPGAAIARHMLGLRNGLPGARRWRQVWSDHRLKDLHPREVMALAHDAVAQGRVGHVTGAESGRDDRPGWDDSAAEML